MALPQLGDEVLEHFRAREQNTAISRIPKGTSDALGEDGKHRRNNT
jgi:hypothetical protein